MPPREGYRLPLSIGLLPSPVDPNPMAMTCLLRSSPITGPSSLLRSSPPLTGASVLSASRDLRLCLFPWHRRPGSQVPHKSPDESHASCTPDTAWPISRLPPHSSRSTEETPVLMSSNPLAMLQQRFACARLSHPYMTQSLPRLLTMTLTTAAFDRSSSWLFEASPYKATPKGQPSSLIQHGAYTPSWHNFRSGHGPD